jgi:hypothetical protein
MFVAFSSFRIFPIFSGNPRLAFFTIRS